MRELHVAIDNGLARSPAALRGLGRYLEAVLRSERPGEWRYIQIAGDAGALNRRTPGLYQREVQLKRLPEWHVFHATSPLQITLLPSSLQRTVVSVLDVIPLDVPLYQRWGIRTRLLHRLAARSAGVLTLSSYSASRIVDRMRVPEERVIVAPLPATLRRSARPVRPPGTPYVLAVADLSTPDPRKRHAWLGAVADRIAALGLDLKIVGKFGPLPFEHRHNNVRQVGPVTDDDLAWYYSHAECVVLTTAYEGQGLPALEAMACGAVPIAFANSSLPEIMGKAGILVEERTPEPSVASIGPHSSGDLGARDLAEAVATFLRLPTRDRRAATLCSLAQAQRFTWDRFAKGLGDAYRRAAA